MVLTKVTPNSEVDSPDSFAKCHGNHTCGWAEASWLYYSNCLRLLRIGYGPAMAIRINFVARMPEQNGATQPPWP